MEGAYGAKLIGKLKTMNVLVVGLKGLGVEIAKNLILAGPKRVTLCDMEPVKIADLGTNMYLREAHIGTPRAKCCLEEFGTMNPNVIVEEISEVTEASIKRHDVIVISNTVKLADLIRFNEIARENGTKFIIAQTRGCTATVFSDFGPKHVTFDEDGTLPVNLIVEHIHIDARPGFPSVITVDSDRHGLHAGDAIRLENVLLKGQKAPCAFSSKVIRPAADGKPGVASSINGIFVVKPFVIEHTDEKGKKKKIENFKKFEIGDLSELAKDFPEYASGGDIVTEKLEKEFKYNSLAEQIVNPTFEEHYEDFTKFASPPRLHVAFRALLKFLEDKDRLPAIHSRVDSEAVYEIAKAIDADNAHEPTVKKFALFADTELPAFCAMFGGIVAQEIVKQTGKYTPITQWIHYDALELLGNATAEPPRYIPVDGTPIGSRYDHQIACFGKRFQQLVGRQNLFLVGCGALGCEFMKAIAMIGLGCDGGKVHITDMDTIELSNLSRQFLFRREHIGKMKSESAAFVASKMNPSLAKSLTIHNEKVAPTTEGQFNDNFWDSLDFVINALDNMIARKYTDSKCVLHGLPLFESGTLGTQANTAVCLPHLTGSYAEGAEAGETQGIAQCTLQNFPSLPLHCIEFAREKFNELFIGGAQKLADFLENAAGFIDRNSKDKLAELDGLLDVKKWLGLLQQASLELCVKMSFDEFCTRYHDNIRNLTHSFPKDARAIDPVTKADMGEFWKGHKRFPRYADYDANNEMHIDFVYQTSCLLCSVFCLPEPSVSEVAKLSSSLQKTGWTPKKVSLEEEKKSGVSQDEAQQIKDLKAELLAMDLSIVRQKRVKPAEFEKDDDTNHHIDWIAVASNMRAWNYYIKASSAKVEAAHGAAPAETAAAAAAASAESDEWIAPVTKAEARLTAGRIIPAIATTTACITGFVQVEIYKYLLGRPLEDFREVTLDLGKNSIVQNQLPDAKFQRSGKTSKIVMDKDGKPVLEDGKPKKEIVEVICIPDCFTTWDSIIIKEGNLSISELVTSLTRKLSQNGRKVRIDNILYDKMALYSRENPYTAMGGPKSINRKHLQNASLSAEKRATFQEFVDKYEGWTALHSNVDEKAIDKFSRLGCKLNAPDRKYLVAQPQGQAVSGQDEDGDDIWVEMDTPKMIYYFQ